MQRYVEQPRAKLKTFLQNESLPLRPVLLHNTRGLDFRASERESVKNERYVHKIIMCAQVIFRGSPVGFV